MNNTAYNTTLIIITLIMWLLLPACSILLPVEEATYVEEKYSINVKDISATANAVTTNGTPLLSWTGNRNIATFDLQICDDDDVSGPLLVDAAGLTSNSYQITTPLSEYGRYGWRVRARTKNGELSKWYLFHFSYLETQTFDSFEIHDGNFSTLHDWTLSEYNHGNTCPYIQDTRAYDGEYAVALPAGSTMETQLRVTRDTMLLFYLQKTSSIETLALTIDNENYNRVSIKNALESWTPFWCVLKEGTHTVRWRNTNNHYQEDVVFIDAIQTQAMPDFSNAFEEWDDSVGTINSITRSGDEGPYIDPLEACAGSYSVIIGGEAPTGNSIFEAQVTIHHDSYCSFYYRKNNTTNFGADLYFRINGGQKLYTWSPVPEWTEVRYVLPAGEHTLEWEHDKYYDETERAWIDDITVMEIPDFSNAFEEWDNTVGTINSIARSGSAEPYIDPFETYAGSYSVIFGEEASTGDSIFQTQVTMASDGIISFRYKRTNTNTGALLYFRIDGVQELSTWNPEPEWVEVSYPLPAGEHTLEWEHDKYYDYNERAWIDDITAMSTP
ncbi:MAG: hypothetical protein JXB03_09335 [Spirochaetales bacterium]|nr:hypothetical protein [Spirochaetales bacterium]